MKLKVLKSELWMKFDLDPEWRGADHALLGSDRYPEIPPVFNRDGIYLNGKECWAEIQGRAFKFDSKQFKFELDLLNAGEYDEQSHKALREICKVNLATKAQQRLLYSINLFREVRNTKRRSRMHFNRIFHK